LVEVPLEEAAAVVVPCELVVPLNVADPLEVVDPLVAAAVAPLVAAAVVAPPLVVAGEGLEVATVDEPVVVVELEASFHTIAVTENGGRLNECPLAKLLIVVVAVATTSPSSLVSVVFAEVRTYCVAVVAGVANVVTVTERDSVRWKLKTTYEFVPFPSEKPKELIYGIEILAVIELIAVCSQEGLSPVCTVLYKFGITALLTNSTASQVGRLVCMRSKSLNNPHGLANAHAVGCMHWAGQALPEYKDEYPRSVNAFIG